HDPLSGPADNRMAAYLAGSHHPNQAKRPRSAYIAVSGEAVVGYIAGHLTRRFDCDAEVQYLFVAPAHRRHRVATALLRLLSMWFVEQGAARVCVNVDPHSVQAVPFYSAMGAAPMNEHWYIWNDISDSLAKR